MVSEYKVNKDNEKTITEYFHDNGNIKTEKVREVKKDTKTKKTHKLIIIRDIF